MKLRVAYVLATWFGCGLVPGAPGTVGTLGALPLYWWLRSFGPYGVAVGALAITVVGVWASNQVARTRGEKDSQIIVIDEVAGMLITLAPGAHGWGVVVGVIAFRVFDQWKPWPANVFEARLPGGWGIVMDDVAAGIWAALLLLAVRPWIAS
jgi:phosphatidylglycerophosphatase A